MHKQHVERPNISQNPLQKDMHKMGNETETVAKINITNPEEDPFNESLITLLNDQQDLQR